MALKLFTYRILLLTFFLMSSQSVFAQSLQQQFEETYARSQEILYDDPEKAVELGMKAYEIAKEAEDIWAMSMANMGIGFISFELGEYKTAYTNYTTALRVLKKSDTSDYYHEAIILGELALIQNEFNNHDGAITHYQQAIKAIKNYNKYNPEHARENGYLNWLVDTHYYLALAHQDRGAHQTAGKILFDLWEQSEDQGDVATYALVLNELGLIKSNNGEYNDAQQYLGLVIAADGVDDFYRSIAYHNLAITYMEQGEFERADNYFQIGLGMTKELNDPYSLFVTYQDIGELEYRKENSKKAIEYWEAALDVYQDIETDPDLYSIYNWLQLAYMDIDVSKAKEYNLKHTQLNDFYVKNQSVQRELEAQNREELSAWIDQERQTRVDAEQRQMFIKEFWPVFLGVALLLIFSGVIGVRYLRTIRANKALAQKQMSVTAVHTRDEAA